MYSTAKLSIFDCNTSFDDDHITGLAIGPSYYLAGNKYLSANYKFREDQLNPELDNLFTVQMQVTL